MAQIQQVKEKYDVQCLLHNSWKTQMSFDLDQRHQAMDQAKNLSLRNPQIPVRVVLDGFNYTTKHHTQAVIYKSANYLNVVRAQKQVVKVRLGFWGYVGVVINTLLMCVLGGLAIMAVTHLGLSGLYATFDPATYKLALMSVFGLVFFGILYFSIGYIRSRYTYVPNATGSVFYWKKKASPVVDLQNVKSAVDERVQHDMSNAARAISYMPVNDHRRKKQSPYENMKADELKALFQQDENIQQEISPVQNSADVDHMIFLKDFSLEARRYLEGAKMKLKGQNQWGYSLFLMGAVRAYASVYQLDDKKFETCQSALLRSIGWKGIGLDQFLFDYEAVEDDDIEQELIQKGASTMKRVLAGNYRALRDVAYFIQQWKVACHKREDSQANPFIMACELKAPVVDAGLQAGPAWPVEWATFLGPLSDHIFDIQTEIIVLDFAQEQDVLNAVGLIREQLGESAQTQVRFSLCDIGEDEITGTRALEILADAPQGAFHISQTVYANLEDRNRYQLTQLDDVEPPVWSFEGGIEDTAGNPDITRAKPMVMTSLPDFS